MDSKMKKELSPVALKRAVLVMFGIITTIFIVAVVITGITAGHAESAGAQAKTQCATNY